MKRKGIFIFVISLLLGIGVDKLLLSNSEMEDANYVKNEESKGTLSMMLETEAESGEYVKTTANTWPTTGYKFNSSLSKCENGGKLSWDDEAKAVLMSGGSSDKCYIYFDKEVLKLTLNNYTFNWNSVGGASTYKVYNDNNLLATTNSTNVEVYKNFYEAGSYNINVKAYDSSNNLIVASKPISYTLEKTDTSFITETDWLVKLNKKNSEYGNYCNSISGEYSCWGLWYKAISPNSKQSLFSINSNYFINYFNYSLYQNHNELRFGNRLTNGGGFSFYSENGDDIRLASDYCLHYDCLTSDMINFSYVDGGHTYSYDSTLKNISINTVSTSYYNVYLLFQLIEYGKTPSDWYAFYLRVACLSENNYVYVYEKRRKKCKRKRIGEVDYEDLILCWDFDNGIFAFEKPIWIMKEKTTNKYNLLRFSDGSVLETIDEHRIYNKEKKKFTYPMTSDTPVGTTTFNANGEYVKLISKEVIEKPIKYYNVIVKNHINLFANDILTSCRLNNIYPIDDMKFVKEEVINNGIDFSMYSENIVKGLRLHEQSLNASDLNAYVDNLIKNQK